MWSVVRKGVIMLNQEVESHRRYIFMNRSRIYKTRKRAISAEVLSRVGRGHYFIFSEVFHNLKNWIFENLAIKNRILNLASKNWKSGNLPPTPTNS